MACRARGRSRRVGTGRGMRHGGKGMYRTGRKGKGTDGSGTGWQGKGMYGNGSEWNVMKKGDGDE